MTDIQDLDSAVTAFSNAEAALRQLAERSERISAATEQLTEARSDLEQLRERLRRDFDEELVASELKSAERIEEQVNDIRLATMALTSATATSNERVAQELATFGQAGAILDRASRDLATAERTLADARSDIREMILVHSDISRELKMAAAALAALRPEGLALRLDDIQEAVSTSESKILQSLEAANAAQTEAIDARLESAAQSQQRLAKKLSWTIGLLLISLIAVIGFGVALLLS